jgi:glycosyltransferase involved in cell wall biosynthesis
MSRILIISLVFAPDGVSTATLVSALAADLQQLEHTVQVITTVPHYNLEPEARAAQPLHPGWWGVVQTSRYQGIPVWHTAVANKKEGAGGRILGYLIFNLLTLLIGLFAIGPVDAILVVSPPLTSGVVSAALGWIKRARTLYNVQELYPDTFVRMGTLRPEALTTRLLYRIESWIYRHTDALTTISEAFARSLRSKGAPPERVHVIPNFVDITEIQSGSKDNPLAREHGLVESFVVLYAGNLGLTQSFDTLLSVAARLRDHPAIRIVIVGDGVRRADLAEQIAQEQLTQVLLLPYQPRSRVPDIYASADLGLVPLMAGTAETTLPSKLYTIMAAGRPVLAAVDAESDIIHTVQQANCGYTIAPDDAQALHEAILHAYANRDQLAALGQNGRQYVESHFQRSAISQQYHRLLQQLVQP